MSLSPYGVLELPWWGYALVTFVTIQTMFLGVTLYLHRDQSHGGLILHPALRHLFRFWLWFSSGAVTREWVAVHRKHHACADREGDPHSPVVNEETHLKVCGIDAQNAHLINKINKQNRCLSVLGILPSHLRILVRNSVKEYEQALADISKTLFWKGYAIWTNEKF